MAKDDKPAKTQAEKDADMKKMQQKAKEKRDKDAADKVAHENAIKADVVAKNPGKDEAEIAKIVEHTLEGEKLNRDIVSARAKYDTAVIARWQYDNPSSGISKEKIEKLLKN